MSKTVLVVDDDEGLQGTLETILADEGYLEKPFDLDALLDEVARFALP